MTDPDEVRRLKEIISCGQAANSEQAVHIDNLGRMLAAEREKCASLEKEVVNLRIFLDQVEQERDEARRWLRAANARLAKVQECYRAWETNDLLEAFQSMLAIGELMTDSASAAEGKACEQEFAEGKHCTEKP